MATLNDKRTKRQALVAWHQAELDTLLAGAGTAGSIAALTATIDTLTAIPAANRTVEQKAQLDNARAARIDARRWVKTAKLVLLLDGAAVRDGDLGGDG